MTDLRRIILKCMLGSLAVAAVAGVLAALTASHVITRATGTCFMTAVAALLMLPLSLMVDRKKLRSAGLCGIVVVGICVLLLLMIIREVERILPGAMGRG